MSFSRPRALRLPSVARHIYETGVTAIPIVSLIAFLISVVVAYLGAQQLSRFGATIFVVDLVAIGVLREMGVLLTAIIVAGRSGSAFAAEIGAMQLNEETDALRAMGMNPVELLVLPRMLGLIIALPLLTVIADAMGLAGGCLLSLLELHIPPAQFISRLREAISATTFWAGLIKAPVFALLIGVVGTYRGMQVRESARELGRLTTVAVVQSIFLVILADALFAVFYEQNRLLMTDSALDPIVRVRGLVNRFGAQIVHDGPRHGSAAQRDLRRGRRFGSRQVGTAAHDPRVAAAAGRQRRDVWPRRGASNAPGTARHGAQLRRDVPERGVDQLVDRRAKHPAAPARVLLDAGGRAR